MGTPLHFVALGENIGLLKMLLDAGACVKPNSSLQTPLHWAAKAGSPDVVRKLLRASTTEVILQCDDDGLSAKFWAEEYDRQDVVKLIVSALKRKAKKRRKRNATL